LHILTFASTFPSEIILFGWILSKRYISQVLNQSSNSPLYQGLNLLRVNCRSLNGDIIGLAVKAPIAWDFIHIRERILIKYCDLVDLRHFECLAMKYVYSLIQLHINSLAGVGVRLCDYVKNEYYSAVVHDLDQCLEFLHPR